MNEFAALTLTNECKGRQEKMQPHQSNSQKNMVFLGIFCKNCRREKSCSPLCEWITLSRLLDKRRLFRLLLKMGIPTNCKVFLQQHSFFSSNNHGDSARFFLKGHFAWKMCPISVFLGCWSFLLVGSLIVLSYIFRFKNSD